MPQAACRSLRLAEVLPRGRLADDCQHRGWSPPPPAPVPRGHPRPQLLGAKPWGPGRPRDH